VKKNNLFSSFSSVISSLVSKFCSFDGQRIKNTGASASTASVSNQGIVSGKAQLTEWKEYFQISPFYKFTFKLKLMKIPSFSPFTLV